MKTIWISLKFAAVYTAIAVKNVWRKFRGLPPINDA